MACRSWNPKEPEREGARATQGMLCLECQHATKLCAKRAQQQTPNKRISVVDKDKDTQLCSVAACARRFEFQSCEFASFSKTKHDSTFFASTTTESS